MISLFLCFVFISVFCLEVKGIASRGVVLNGTAIAIAHGFVLNGSCLCAGVLNAIVFRSLFSISTRFKKNRVPKISVQNHL